MSEKWTTDYPKAPGYYWIRNYRFNSYPDKPEWNEIHESPTPVEIDKAGQCFFIGWEVERERDEFLSAEWFGPIQSPLD